MHRDIFGDLIDPPRVTGGKSWIAVATTMMIEVVAIAIVVIAPLMVVGFFPKPPLMLAFTSVPPLPLPPPPPPLATRREKPIVDELDMRAPVEPPKAITAEPESIPAGFERSGEHSPVIGGSMTVEPPPPPPVPDVPLRVGGKIKQPQKTRDVRPIYPEVARISKVQGLVIIEAVIGPDGSVRDARVLRSNPLLDQAALDAVRQWQFTPTLLNGRPVPVIMTVTVQFMLH